MLGHKGLRHFERVDANMNKQIMINVYSNILSLDKHTNAPVASILLNGSKHLAIQTIEVDLKKFKH